jgi:hypothetical protein
VVVAGLLVWSVTDSHGASGVVRPTAGGLRVRCRTLILGLQQAWPSNRDGEPEIRDIKAGAALLREGEPGDKLMRVLDGIVRVDVGGRRVAEYGPGSIHGERAILEGGRRTATVTAASPVRVAIVPANRVDPKVLAVLREVHRREELI